MESDASPEKGTVSYLAGEMCVETSKEQLYSHNRLKNEFARVLEGLARKKRMGEYFGDGVLLSNIEADLSSKPDGIFVLAECFRDGAVELIEGAQEGYVELVGAPSMVLEVVSTSSVRKDCESLRELYWKAGIAEYWLVDARGDQLQFDILRRTSRGYSVTRKSVGWIKSTVFEQSFRLIRKTNEWGHPQ